MRRIAVFLTALLPTVSAAMAAKPTTFTLAVIGDQQRAVDAQDEHDYLDRFTSQTKWLAANAAQLNLRIVLQVGDIVEHGPNRAEYDAALAGMQILDSATNADGGHGIPWCVAYGNHEIIGAKTKPAIDLAGPEPSANYRHYFGSASGAHRYASQPEFKGVSRNDLNTWHVIRASSDKDANFYLILNLEVDVPGDKDGTNFNAVEWARKILKEHPGMPTIVVTHVFEGTKHGPPKNSYIRGFGHNSQLEIFEKLVKNNPQIFMVLSGHTSEDTHQVKQNADSQPVLQMVTDYNKWLGTAGDGFFRLIEINEITGKARIRTYSALLDQYRTDENSDFEVSYDHTRLTISP